MKTLTDIIRYTLITCLLLMAETAAAQIVVEDSTARHDNGIFHIGDSLIEVDDAALEGTLMADTIQFQKNSGAQSYAMAISGSCFRLNRHPQAMKSFVSSRAVSFQVIPALSILLHLL